MYFCTHLIDSVSSHPCHVLLNSSLARFFLFPRCYMLLPSFSVLNEEKTSRVYKFIAFILDEVEVDEANDIEIEASEKERERERETKKT
jgi:hypothetical protein